MDYSNIIWEILQIEIFPGEMDLRVWCDSVHGKVTSQLAYLKLRPSFPVVS